MATLIIEGDNDQIATVMAFLKSVGISFQTKQDATEYLLSNKTELLDSIKEARDGNTRKLGLDDIWK